MHFLRNGLDYLHRQGGDDCLIELRWLYGRRDDAEAPEDLAAWVLCWQEKYPKLSARVEENIEALRVINPAALPTLPSCNDHSTSFTSRGPREKPRFPEILALKSLRKGWENETEQWQILIEFRLPKLTPETRTHRARWGLRQSGGGKSLSQSTRPDHSYRSDLLIGETIVSFSRFFISERHQCSRRPKSVLPS
jgi:Transposase, Mutator family